MSRRLVTGLGNPGPEYEHTWHNLGFHVIRRLAEKQRIGLHRKGDSLVGQGTIGGKEVTLLMPLTYMNLSGHEVAHWAKKLNLHDDEILVVYDDHDLPRGLMRLRSSGGDGGHRGMRSVLAEVGSNAVQRFRLGIRDESLDPEAGGYEDLADRVLQPLTACEEKHVETIVEAAAKAIRDWVDKGAVEAMNRHNNRRIPAPKTDQQISKDREKIHKDSSEHGKGNGRKS